jgi:hypothetical protein
VIIVPDRDLEVLRHRLTERDVTIQEVHAYIQLQHRPVQGQAQQFLADFVTAQDLVSFWQLYDWWAPVPDKPATLPVPSIIHFCWNVNYTPSTVPVTFMAAMHQWYGRAVAWLKQVDRDVVNPGESAEERTRRRNRERMAKVRGHRPVNKKSIAHDEVLSAQVRDLEAQCEMLKQTAAEDDTRLKEDVLGYQKRMIDASEERKRVASEHKERIEKLRTEIRSLITKQ